MTTNATNQEKEGPVKPPSKDDVITMLKAFKEHVDSGGGLGQNEEGDEFIEIQEEWDAEGNVISQETIGGTAVIGTSTAALRQIDIEDDDGNLLEEEEEVDFDDDAFDSMMQEMEKLELAAEQQQQQQQQQQQSSGLSAGETSKSAAKSGSASAASAAGMKKGFLLSKEAQKPPIKTPTANAPAPAPPTKTNRPTAFTGAVIERQPHSTSAAAPSRLPAASIDSQQDPSAPQRVSKFKQRMYS